MIKNILSFITVCLAFACGSPIDTDDSMDIGQAEQAFNAPKTNTYVLGTTEGTAKLRCTTTNATQVCDIPTTRVFTYCDDNLNTEETSYSLFAPAAQDSTHHFTWTRLAATGAACQAAFANGTANVLINHLGGVCPSGTTNIESFVCASVNPIAAQLPESPSVPGSFFGINGGIIHIDRAKLLATFPNATDRNKAGDHGVAHAALAVEGIGARSDFGSNGNQFWSNRAALPLTGPGGRVLTAGENCTLAFYSSALFPGVYSQDTTSCSTD